MRRIFLFPTTDFSASIVFSCKTDAKPTLEECEPRGLVHDGKLDDAYNKIKI